jgi:hypothetical protein
MSVLFTVVVASTERRVRLGEDAADDLQRTQGLCARAQALLDSL